MNRNLKSRKKMLKINIISLSIFVLFVGCSIKKKDASHLSNDRTDVSITGQNEAKKDLLDSDHDGISDEVEIKMGTNTFIADIPKISVGFVQDVSVGAIFNLDVPALINNKFSLLRQEFSEIDGVKGGDLDLLKVLRRKVVKNQYNHLRNIKAEKTDIIVNDDLRSNILSSWGDDSYYSFMDALPKMDSPVDNDSGKFIANLKVKITNATNVTEISDINLKSFFYDYEKMEASDIYDHYLLKASGSKERFKLDGRESFEPVTIYPLIANELKSSDVYSRLVDRSEIGIAFTDYSYVHSGIALNYREVLNNVFDGDAKIIFSDQNKTEVFFVSPTLTIMQALQQLGKRIKLGKDGDIYSINEIERIAKYPIDMDTLTINDLKNGIWSVFGDADHLEDQMKAQGLYVISYATLSDILNTSKSWAQVTDSTEFSNLKLDNIYNADEVLLDIQDIKETILIESISRRETAPVMIGAGCNFIEPIQIDKGMSPICNIRPGCYDDIATPITSEDTISFSQLSLSDIKKWFSFEDSYGEKINAKIFKYGNKVKIKFDSLNDHFRNTINISFKNPDNLNSSARNGVVSGTCRGASFSTQAFANQFKITGSVKVFGINKY